ncbi:MAG TPA: twin-arginine translocase subunit TatC [Sedimentisphaerales bacterium]|nr:twin-arginine translocase subunit TatC [Sedimentisphaerales bacterium]
MSDLEEKEDLDLRSTMSLGDHLEDLRRRLLFAIVDLVIATALCLLFGQKIIAFIEIPFTDVVGNESNLQSLAPSDVFASYMKITLVAGLIISSPWVFYHLWMFVAAGLYPRERRYVTMAVPFSAALFVAGALFFMFVVAPMALQFFMKFNSYFRVDTAWTFQNYISFVTIMMLVFGLSFQTPIAIFILTRIGLVSVEYLKKIRKYVFLAAFIIGAVVTPGPDVISQIALAIPLYGLFELGLFLSYIADRKKKA